MILLTKSYNYPIQPRHIAPHGPTQTGLDAETETAARRIVWFCQDRNDSWQPFTKADINQLFRAMRMEGEFSFASLPEKLVKLDEDGTCTLTHEFVSLCFKATPTNIL